MSLPVCPECVDGWQDCGTGDFAHGCRACGGSGVDITEITEAAWDHVEGLTGFTELSRRTIAREVVLAVLAVLDKEGT